MNIFESIEEAKEIIGNYIDFYNRKRPHSSLNYKTPVEFERGSCYNMIKQILSLKKFQEWGKATTNLSNLSKMCDNGYLISVGIIL